MSQLPYTFTICPPGPEPKRYSSSCAEMVCALMGGDDLTIDQRKAVLFPQPGKTNLEVVPAAAKGQA